MFRLFLVTLTLCPAVFAFPPAADSKEELTRDLEQLVRILDRKLEDETERQAGPEESRVQPVTLVDIVNPQTEQSSTLQWNGQNLGSDKAVDKNFNSDLINGGSCAHTLENGSHPWWSVTLREPHCIAEVGILNRRDGDYDRLAGATVLVGYTPCGSVSAQSASIPGGLNVVHCGQPINGDKISIHIPKGQATLQICEVLIWEVPNC